MNPYIIVNGQSSLPEKINAVNKISSSSGRQQWKTALTKNRNLIYRSDTAVILNNRRASITFRFNASAGNYDIYLRCIAPSSNTDTGVIRLDATKPKILDLKRRPKKYISQQVNVKLFSNILLSNGGHTLTVGYREPIGLIRLIVRKKRSNLQIVIPAVDTLYKPPKPPAIQPAPPAPPVVAAYESTTQAPIIEAEYKPVEIITTSSEAPYEVITTSSEAPYEVITTPSGAPYETSSGSPQIIPSSTTSQPSVMKPLKKEVSEKEKKGFPWWGILLIILVLCVLLFLVYRMWKGKRETTVAQGKDDRERRMLQWIQTLPQERRSQFAFFETALRKSRGQRSQQQQALITRMQNCRHMNQQAERVLLQWLQNGEFSQSLKEETNTLAEALRKSPVLRTPQQTAHINRMLNCRDPNKQQQELLEMARKYADNQNLQQFVKKRFGALVEALEKKPKQRNQQQKDLVAFALNCKGGKQLLSKIQQKQPVPQPPVALADFLSTTRFNQQQQTPTVKPQVLQTTMRSTLANKLIQEEKKRKLNILKDEFDLIDLDAQVFALNRDKQVFQYLQKFDASSDDSRQQFPKIKQRLNQLLPAKKDNSLIEKILQQSLKKVKQQEQRETSALQGAAALFGKAQQDAKKKQQEQRETSALQGAAALFGKAQQDAKKKQQEQRETSALQGAATLFGKAQQDLKPKVDFKKFLQVGRKQGILKEGSQQNVSKISQILKKASAPSQPSKTKVRLTPDIQSSQQTDAYQRQFGQTNSNAPAF
jgi:hypothetical protein